MKNLSAKTGISREFGHWVLGGFSIGLPEEKLNASRYLLLANGLANESFGCLLDRCGEPQQVSCVLGASQQVLSASCPPKTAQHPAVGETSRMTAPMVVACLFSDELLRLRPTASVGCQSLTALTWSACSALPVQRWPCFQLFEHTNQGNTA